MRRIWSLTFCTLIGVIAFVGLTRGGPPVPQQPLPEPILPVAGQAEPAVGFTSPSRPPLPVPVAGPAEPSFLAPVAAPTPPEPAIGRQEPAVTLEWVGPTTSKVGQAVDYAIVVRNVCSIPVQQVLVRVRLPQSISAIAHEPRAVGENGVLMWDLGTMLPRQDKTLSLKLMPTGRGDITCQSWVTFTGASAMTVRVREPKLALKAVAPEKVLLGDPANIVLSVTNPGDSPAERVRVRVDLTAGLECSRGNKIDFEIGTLAAGETRNVQVICAAKAGGMQACEAVAESDGGLRVEDRAVTTVVVPRLDLQVTAPKTLFMDRKKTFTFKVTNPGDAPANNVVISEVIPPGFKFVSADCGGQHDIGTRVVSWFLGEIAAGQSREVKVELLPSQLGETKHTVTAGASRGLRTETELVTRVEGLSALLVEVVDTEDPVEVNGDTTYEVRVTNTGSKTESDVRLTCTFPPGRLQFKDAHGPTSHTLDGHTVTFEPLSDLAPRAEAVYRIRATMLSRGVAIFQATISSSNLPEGVIKQESTTGYHD